MLDVVPAYVKAAREDAEDPWERMVIGAAAVPEAVIVQRVVYAPGARTTVVPGATPLMMLHQEFAGDTWTTDEELFRTVTATAVLVARLPAASLATAVKLCEPFDVVLVSQKSE